MNSSSTTTAANNEAGKDDAAVQPAPPGREDGPEGEEQQKKTNAAFLSRKVENLKARSAAEIVNEHQALLLTTTPDQVIQDEDSACASSVTMPTYLPPLGTLYPSVRSTQLELATMEEEEGEEQPEICDGNENNEKSSSPVKVKGRAVSSKTGTTTKFLSPNASKDKGLDEGPLGDEMRLTEEGRNALDRASTLVESEPGPHAVAPAANPAPAAAPPGAYAIEGPDGPASFEENPSSTEEDNTARLEENVPVASAVEEGISSRDLPLAERFPAGSEINKSKLVLVLVVLLVGAVGLALLFALLAFLPGSSSDEASYVSVVTTAPTRSYQEDLKVRILDTLREENFTLESLKTDDSAQSRALQWILDDPLVGAYSTVEWRLRQRFALATLYYATEGPNWDSNDNWLSYQHHECSWWSQGFFAPSDPEMIFPIVDPQNPCELHEEIEVESSLASEHDGVYKHMWLQLNNLSGELPHEISWLTSLRSMALYVGGLQGTVPTSICALTDLEAFSVSRNNYEGTIPTCIGDMPSLSLFSLAGNPVAGTLPTELFTAPALQTLMIDGTDITGSIPTNIGQLSLLYVLYLDGAPLTGTLPSEIGQLAFLDDVDLSDANFSGQLPCEVGRLGALQRLDLSNNAFTGTLCTEFQHMSSLHSFEVQHNDISGTIPSELGAMENLMYLFLQDNRLTGTVPLEVAVALDVDLNATESTGPSSLKAWNVSNNLFSGVYAPSELCQINATFLEDESCLTLPGSERSFSCRCECTCQ